MTEERGLLFDRVAEEYDRVRSDYPAEIVDAACAIGELDRGSRVLEIGCGTGKLTEALTGARCTSRRSIPACRWSKSRAAG
jgi:ubiquinone/menaquinone biosynthesis C-methylase UbiE